MAEYLRTTWRSSILSGLSKRDRRGCLYDAYLPDRLSKRSFQLDGDVASDVADAEAAIIRFNQEATTLTNTEVLARLLLRAESAASSEIEGLVVGGGRLLRAELARQVGDRGGIDITAAEVLANVDAMAWAAQAIPQDEALTPDHILEVHRRLLSGSRLDAYAGRLREVQNWIGGSSVNPCAASFVPPPHEFVPGLLEDLCTFCNSDSLPAVVQAALAHAQFETIHPFVDGNGRTGRVLIQIILRRRGLAPRVLPPVSLILATWTRDYIDALTRTHYVGAVDSREAHDGYNQWIALFATACRRSIEDAAKFETQTAQLRRNWRDRLESVRRNSSLDLLIEVLPGIPLLTVGSAAGFINRSFQTTNEAIDKMVEAGILTQINLGRRNRAFEAREVVSAFNQLERRLASPEGDTNVSEPVRTAPSRLRSRHS